MKYVFVSFDISKDKIRNLINKELKKLGLKNIQYSVFLGGLKDESIVKIKDLSEELLEKEDKICILEIRKDNLHKIKFFDFQQNLLYLLNESSISIF